MTQYPCPPDCTCGLHRTDEGPRVDREPIARFLREWLAADKRRTKAELARRSGVHPRRISRLTVEETDYIFVGLGLVDRVLRGIGREEMLTILYPD